MRFEGICFITTNVNRLKNFYQDILQLELEEESDEFVKFLFNGIELSIYSNVIVERMAPGSMRNTGPGSFTIEIEVDDVDKEYERLKEKDITIVKPPTTQVWGVRSVWFRDPDGNIINFHTDVK
jgi:catechol 2,3-dioxygenase-like lactoylglutathione lyase family enzyme